MPGTLWQAPMETIILRVPYFLDFSAPLVVLLWLAAIVLALSLHEFCHALAATSLGDQTARLAGRLSLNPLVHVDPLGMVMAVVAGFGWAKPVPFNPYNLRVQQWGPTLVAFAGPISNFLQAAVAGIAIRLAWGAGVPESNLLMIFLGYYFLINVGLFFFNLIPIPPLDGSKFLLDLLSGPQHARTRFFLETRGPFLLLLVLSLQYLIGISVFGILFSLVYRYVFFPLFGVVVQVL